MQYRPDIDGLRAIAVLSVLLFHGGISFFSGGFIGVDIFFVISGYLITTSIIEQKQKGTFSVRGFYERRARRILPALFLVMAVSIPFAWAWLLPKELRDFFQSITAASTFVSNIFFWKETGYFETASELKPLLHTWSLAVEEQYYILFPIFISLFWVRGKKWLFNTLLIVSALSLIAAQISSAHAPSANFFLPHTRIWEILAGALIPFYFLKNSIKTPLNNTALSLFGLSLIAFSIVYFDPSIPFPSFYALIPIIGTCLVIIFSHVNNFTGRLLGNKLFVGIGLISYSVYLWHQPIFALTKQFYNIDELSASLFFALSALTIALSYLSWKYVETPFRNKTKFDQKSIFRLSIIGLVFFLAIGITGDITKGFRNRTTANGISFTTIEQKLRPNHGLSHACESVSPLNKACQTSDAPEILVWGDSYAMHLTHGIIASNPDVKLIQMTKSVCGPIFDLAPITEQYNKTWAQGCIEFNARVKEWLQSQTSIKYAVLSSPFSQYLAPENTLFSKGNIVKTDVSLVVKKLKETLEIFKEMGIKPIIFSPPPTNGQNLGRCLAQNLAHGSSLNTCDFLYGDIKNKNVFDFLDQFNGNDVVRFDQLMCPNGVCSTHDQSTFLYRDVGHFSNEGTTKMGETLNYYRVITKSN